MRVETEEKERERERERKRERKKERKKERDTRICKYTYTYAHARALNILSANLKTNEIEAEKFDSFVANEFLKPASDYSG